MTKDEPSGMRPADGAPDPLARHRTPVALPVRRLEVRESFDALSRDERHYAHWMGVAAWAGLPITLEQGSAESPAIFELLLRVFALPRTALRRAASRRGVADEAWRDAITYAARFLANAGNYLGFGDTKFVPRCRPEDLDGIVAAAATLDAPGAARLQELWARVRGPVFRLQADDLRLGLPPEGRSRYYGAGVTVDDAERAAEFLRARDAGAWNTRLARDPESGRLQVRVAAVRGGAEGPFPGDGGEIELVRGDHGPHLANVVSALRRARDHAANEGQRRMIDAYVRHFEDGDVEEHKEAMRHWVRDTGPTVEVNLGFIETYRDPLHVRAEWEGFVAIQDVDRTRRLQRLVDRAPELLRRLPWGPEFERDAFLRPDFTSLEVLGFAGSGIPAGINIPNYHDVREDDGFKNVSLGNVLRSSRQRDEAISFLRPEDQELFRARVADSFEVQVGLHELLGHGSGKLLAEDAEGRCNFDRRLENPLTRRPVETWYRPGETWGSRFGRIGGPFEECRAEAVGLLLGLEPDVLGIFGHTGQDAEDVAWCNWLNMARSGVLALRFFDPGTGRWGQAHMQARFALLRVMLAAERDFARVREVGGGRRIELERALLSTVGRPAVADFLLRLHVYRCVGDAAGGTAFFESWSQPEDWMAPLRDEVIAREKPRHVWVQPVTDLDARGEVVLREYDATCDGVVDSFVDRFADRL